MAGAGAVVALAGGALQWSAGRDLRTFEADFQERGCTPGGDSPSGHCSTTELAPGDTRPLRHATWQQRAAVAAYTAGGAAIATGVVLLILNRARPVSQYTEQPSAWLMLAPGHAGAGARLDF